MAKENGILFLIDADGVYYPPVKRPRACGQLEEGKIELPNLSFLEGAPKRRWERARIALPFFPEATIKPLTLFLTALFAYSVHQYSRRRFGYERLHQLEEFFDLARSYQRNMTAEVITSREDDLFHLTRNLIMKEGLVKAVHLNPGWDDTFFKGKIIIDAVKRGHNIVVMDNDPTQSHIEALAGNSCLAENQKAWYYFLGETPSQLAENRPRNLVTATSIPIAAKDFYNRLKRKEI